jgi:N-acetyl-anhydromuramyl-L-alanine amidase AmpD
MVSAHVCVDGEGNSAQYVPDEHKAWHAAGYNSRSLGIEQIGYASFTAALWNRNGRAQLRTVARYIAYWHRKYGIAIRDARGDKRAGVVTHASLHTAGGHYDPGRHYPFRSVLSLAKLYSQPRRLRRRRVAQTSDVSQT